MSKPKQLRRKTVYSSEWIRLHLDEVLFPGGNIISDMHVLEYPKESVAAVVRDAQENFLLVEAYRYHTNSIEWEIPAGGIDTGENISRAAEREVAEESGYRTSDHEVIYTYHPSNGSSNQVFHIVTCTARGTPSQFDTNEVRSVRWFSPAEVRDMIAQKKLRDGFTLSGLLLVMFSIDKEI